MSIIVENFLICRTCLSETGDMVSIMSTEKFEEDESRICDVIQCCIPVQICEGDGLPEQICMQCFEELKRAFLFRNLGEKSDSTLRQLLASASEEIEEIKPEDMIVVTHFTHYIGNVREEDVLEAKESLDAVFDDMFRTNTLIVPSEIDLSHKYEANTCGVEEQETPPEINVSNYLCQNCGFTFETLSSYTQHMSDEHSESIKCQQCDTSFETKSLLDNHICGIDHYEEGIENTTEDSKTCTTCNKTFSSNYKLARHKNTHNKKKAFLCSVCGKGFNGSSHLKFHMFVHTGEKPYKCDLCGKTFGYSKTLKAHKQTHSADKPFLCTVCGKSFGQSSYLKIHMLSHNVEKTFKCKLCDKKFTNLISLSVHKRAHTGEKPYECNICGKRFAQSGNLTAHIRVHTGEKPVECKVCHKRFNHGNRMAAHMRTHTGEKPFVCKVCGSRFASNQVLKVHIRTHTGERPYVCSECGWAFTQNGSLVAHKKIHKKNCTV